MSNLRIIHDNAADRATVTASSTAGSLVAANMQTDIKGQVHRSTGTSVTYALTWATPQTVTGFALPACNLTSSATIRMRGYTDTAGTLLAVDSGTQYACPGANLGLWDWTLPLNANAFAFGGASKALCWLDSAYALQSLFIDIVDTANPAGYIDCSRIVAGGYWSPLYNAGYGATNSVDDNSKNTRNDAGDLMTDRFSSAENMKLDLKIMPTADRARVNQIMRGSGISRPVLIALIPDGADPLLTQDSVIYGKRQNSPMSFAGPDYFETSITIEGW